MFKYGRAEKYLEWKYFVIILHLDVLKLLIVKNIVRNTLIAGRVQMVTCLFPRKGEDNTEILNTYLTVLERDIFKVSLNQRSKNPEP